MAITASERFLSEPVSGPLGFEAGTVLGGTAPGGGTSDPDESNRRNHFRRPVEVCRPIAVGPAHAGGLNPQVWWSADILDLSTGGLCLLLLAEDGFEPQVRLQLDLSSQSGFGVPQLTTSLRWFVVNGAVVTLGVGFDTPYDPLPLLV